MKKTLLYLILWTSSCVLWANTATTPDIHAHHTHESKIAFIENQGQKICGRFKNEQMNKVSIPIPKSVFEKQLSFHKAFLFLLL